jgi:glycosyltransferase involved in cell wall biosynthesis
MTVAPRIAKRTREPRRPVTPPKRILVVSHSHPELTKGGAEIAAYNDYAACAADHPTSTWFLGCTRDPADQPIGTVFSQPFGSHEYLYACGSFDWFNFSNLDPKFPTAFRSLLAELQPDEVRFHHYINIGLEALLHVKETLPDCRIVMTLHEYLAICHHYGQMVTKPNLALCYGASPRRCAGCFPERRASDFSLRKLYVRRFFYLVDEFIAPSEFLATRYRDWGVPSERIRVRDNLVSTPRSAEVPKHIRRMPGSVLRVGYFGQLSKLKGIGVLLDAAEILREQKQTRIVFEIYGSDAGQPPEFQKEFRERIHTAGKNVIYFGAYSRQQVTSLMAGLDVVLVPSIWWENSPLVIHEAIAAGVPVLCSDLGGMAEKANTVPSVDCFPAGNAPVLVQELLSRLSTSKDGGAAHQTPPARREANAVLDA